MPWAFLETLSIIKVQQFAVLIQCSRHAVGVGLWDAVSNEANTQHHCRDGERMLMQMHGQTIERLPLFQSTELSAGSVGDGSQQAFSLGVHSGRSIADV